MLSIDSLAKQLDSVINNRINIIKDKEDEFFKRILYVHAVPQIKGEITPGKLKWRGIKLVTYQKSDYEVEKYFLQRGKMIGEKITVNFSLNLNNLTSLS